MKRNYCMSFIGTFRVVVGGLLFSLAIASVAVPQNPVPLINEPLVPDAAKPGGPGFTLMVNGTGFVFGSAVYWNGRKRVTTFVSSSRLTAIILSSDIAKANTGAVTVLNPGPGGGSSNVAFLQVNIATPAIVVAAPSFRAGASPASVVAGDFNGDGRLDMAVANSASANISILLGAGRGEFMAPTNYSLAYGSHHPNSLAVGDFNRDGKLDLVVANGGSNDVNIFLGDGDGTFQAPQAFVTNSDLDDVEPSSVAVGDFDHDGNLDLAVANPGGLSVLLGNGDGTFKPFVSYAAASTPVWVATGDFNRDGKLDLAVANEGSNTVSVLLGNGDGTFRAPVDYNAGTQPASVAIADLNGDGKLDLAVANHGSNNISVLLGNGNGTFQASVAYRAGSGPTMVAVGDFNGDGKPDLMVANNAINGGTPGVSVLLGKGNGTFPTAVDYTSGVQPQWVTAVDLDSDGRLDLAVADMGSSSSQILTLGASATFGDQVVAVPSPIQSVTLTNYGTSPLTGTSVSVMGLNAGDFSQTNTCGPSIAPKGSCTIDLTFTPAKTGLRTATLSVSDSAPGSPQTMSLTGTGTVVDLTPHSLNFGSVQKNQSKTLSTQLTNTSSTTLNITGITIVGSGPFSQTNDCRSSVAAGKFCTIRVTFKPESSESFTSAVSISDNGGGSPQQVPLSGAGLKRLLSKEAQAALATNQLASVPKPTGLSPVGTRVMDLVDTTRDDPFEANGTKRELLLRFWYPASFNRDCDPAEYTSAKVWSYFSQLAAIPLPEVTTNSCLDAPVSDGPHPVVMFTPGYTATFTDYSFIFEDLASRGYVVASVDHTYEATAVEFPDGRFVKSLLGSHLAQDTALGDRQTLPMAVSVRLDDLKFVADELERLNAENGSPFTGKLDMSRVAVAGHSLGGVTALLGVERDARFKAGVIIDGWPGSLTKPTKTPVLILAAGHEQWSDDECRLWEQLRGSRFAVDLKGSEHVTPTDATWLAKGAIKTGTMGPEKTIVAVRDYIAAFLDQNLLGAPANRLLTGPSADYPDAEVTPQGQALCHEP